MGPAEEFTAPRDVTKKKKKKSSRKKKKRCTGEFDGLAVDDEVRQLLGNLSTLLLVLREVELLTQLHVKHLPAH